MDPNRVATLHAREFKSIYNGVKIIGKLLMISFLMLIASCDKSDELEPIGTETPIHNELPTDNESPTIDESVIVFTDIEPDFTGEDFGDSYNLDLNNDGIIDFIITSASNDDWEWLGISQDSNTGNGIVSVEPWFTYTLPLNSGQEIYNLREYRNGEFYGAGALFSIGDCYHGGGKDCSYNWENKVDKYLGLKFSINEETHYGWALLDIKSLTHWVIREYAYNATPNKPILAGQKN